MRPLKRIKMFLKPLDNEKLLKDIWKIIDNPQEIENVIKLINSHKKEIKKYWLENQDLRYSQVLINLGILPNIPGAWYYWEESEILIELGYKPEDVYYWGVYFNKDMTPLENPVWKPISELNSDHLKAIINGGFVKYNKLYRQTMLKVLRKRGERL